MLSEKINYLEHGMGGSPTSLFIYVEIHMIGNY